MTSSDGEDKLKAVFSKYIDELLQLFLLDENVEEASNRSPDDLSDALEKLLETEHEPLPLRMIMREAVRERKGVDAMVENLFKRLAAISVARRNLRTLQRIYEPGTLRVKFRLFM